MTPHQSSLYPLPFLPATPSSWLRTLEALFEADTAAIKGPGGRSHNTVTQSCVPVEITLGYIVVLLPGNTLGPGPHLSDPSDHTILLKKKSKQFLFCNVKKRKVYWTVLGKKRLELHFCSCMNTLQYCIFCIDTTHNSCHYFGCHYRGL